jgi:hypothetical protein
MSRIKLLRANEADNKPTSITLFQNKGVRIPLLRCIIMDPKLQMEKKII